MLVNGATITDKNMKKIPTNTDSNSPIEEYQGYDTARKPTIKNSS